MIKKTLVNNQNTHIVISANEPIRIEIMKVGTGFILYGYKGIKVDTEQEPTIYHEAGI